MKTLVIPRRQFLELRDYQLKLRRDWHAVFSINEVEELWPFSHWGNTPQEDRIEFRNVPAILHFIVHEYLRIRPPGGRFFISNEGVFYKLDVFGTAIERQFLRFQVTA